MRRKGRQHLPKVGNTPRRASWPNLPGYYLREPLERERRILLRLPIVGRWLGFVVTYVAMWRPRHDPPVTAADGSSGGEGRRVARTRGVRRGRRGTNPDAS